MGISIVLGHYILKTKDVLMQVTFFHMQIDAVAKSRDGKFRIVSNDEREQTLNQLLTVCLFLESIIHF
jgi:hypothetical protein